MLSRMHESCLPQFSECGGCWGARNFEVYKIGVQFGPQMIELKDKMFHRVEQTCDMRRFLFALAKWARNTSAAAETSANTSSDAIDATAKTALYSAQIMCK